MKITDILLEYNRARAAQAIGVRLWQAMVRDILSLNLPLKDFQKSWEEKYPGSYKQYRSVFTDKASQEKLMNNALEQLEEADPTTNKKYTQWMARMFASDPPTKMEDIKSTIAEYLYKFNVLSRKKLLKPEHQDLNRFKDFKSFMDAVDQYELPEEDDNKTGKAEKLYADDTVTVVHPLDEEAACNYGRGTRWCTAAVRSHNYFNQYNLQGPIYILIPKSPKYQGEKYQLHFPSGQFMNEDDEPVLLAPLITERFPGLFEFFKTKEPDELNDLIEFAPDEVLQPVLDKIAEIMIDHINDLVTDWEINNNDYYKWLENEGYVNQEGEVKDNAPSILDFDYDARRFYKQAVDAVKITPVTLRLSMAEFKGDSNSEEESSGIDNIENVLKWRFRQKLIRDTANSLIDYMNRRVHVYKDKEGKWQVRKLAER